MFHSLLLKEAIEQTVAKEKFLTVLAIICALNVVLSLDRYFLYHTCSCLIIYKFKWRFNIANLKIINDNINQIAKNNAHILTYEPIHKYCLLSH
jgi:hypothetical protein